LTVLVNDALGDLDLAKALGEVSPARRAHALRYRFERDRRLSVAVYLLLKEALRKVYGLVENPRIGRGKNGKPFLPDHPGIHFNFSHCPKAAACAVSDRPVGIDVEEIVPVDWEVARSVLSDAELADVRASDEPDVAFARDWTRMEAYAKMTGEGLDGDRLPGVPGEASGCRFETTVNRSRGYVLTTVCAQDRRI